jgi:hypothetical protein
MVGTTKVRDGTKWVCHGEWDTMGIQHSVSQGAQKQMSVTLWKAVQCCPPLPSPPLPPLTQLVARLPQLPLPRPTLRRGRHAANRVQHLGCRDSTAQHSRHGVRTEMGASASRGRTQEGPR